MTEDNAKGFRQAVTIFLDILGSQDRQDFSEWYKIMRIFADTIAREKEYDKAHPHTIYKREIHVFSDCAYIIYDYKPDIEESGKNDEALMCIACYNTEKVLFEFLRNGFLVRGALTLGDVYYDPEQNVWFGPAMNRAYFLENKEARYPRVIIDPQFADNLVAYNDRTYGGVATNGKILKRDNDGLYYIHYLNTYQQGFYAIENDSLAESVLELCKTEMGKQRVTPKEKESICEKYKWLERYIQESSPSHYFIF